jgi:hypothetical protein
MKMMKALWAAALLVACAEAPAVGQVSFGFQVGPPPPAFIATTAPVYFQGRPTYWYNGFWQYRDPRGAWQVYRQEPPFLAQRRVNQPPRRVFYENRRSYGRPDIPQVQRGYPQVERPH